jgi:predicted ATPase
MEMKLLQSIHIQGYRPFRDFMANFGGLEVMVGANGSGKSSLFEFLRWLRDSMSRDIPPEIIPDCIGPRIFHQPGPDRFDWRMNIQVGPEYPPIFYEGALLGPIGRIAIYSESAQVYLGKGTPPVILLDVDQQDGVIQAQPWVGEPVHYQRVVRRTNQLYLRNASSPEIEPLYRLREFIESWRFYSVTGIAAVKVRKSALIEQEPALNEDAGNLSAVLHFLMTEHPGIFDDLNQFLGFAIPGFKRLVVKARGGPGEVMTFWQEAGVSGELTLADLSDGILRLLCWVTLCLLPNPPGLICIDEPDQGVHPRTLPVLSGLFEKASSRTQIFLATHSSYFLAQFDLSRIAVFRKENGEARFLKPRDSNTLVAILEDFGFDEIQRIHQSDELERLA